MRNIEAIIYDLVKDRPVVKDALKFIYQGTFSYFGMRRQYGLDRLTVRERSFFGFHDKNPWSWDNELLLAHRFIGRGNEVESAKRRMQIAIFRGENWLEPVPITETRAWNWQQGCMLQWLPDSMSKIVWNDRKGDHFVCYILDVFTREKRTLPFAIYTISPDGKTALAPDFRRGTPW